MEYNFVYYSVGGEEKTVQFMEKEAFSCSSEPLVENVSRKGFVNHHFPMNYILDPWKLGEGFYQLIKIGIVQYVCYFWCMFICYCTSFFQLTEL